MAALFSAAGIILYIRDIIADWIANWKTDRSPNTHDKQRSRCYRCGHSLMGEEEIQNSLCEDCMTCQMCGKKLDDAVMYEHQRLHPECAIKIILENYKNRFANPEINFKDVFDNE